MEAFCILLYMLSEDVAVLQRSYGVERIYRS